ncbi:MAG: abortive infection family protein [Gaiellaceae bacterium]
MVAGDPPAATTEVVRRAIDDVDSLLAKGGPTSAVDRVHTTLHGHLRYLCDEAGIEYDRDDSTTALLKKIRREHSALQNLGTRADDITKILNASASILDALNPVRNKASVAHPNKDLLGRDEAQLVVNAGRTLLTYLDAKLNAE